MGGGVRGGAVGSRGTIGLLHGEGRIGKTQEPTQRAMQRTVKAEDNYCIGSSAEPTIPNAIKISPHRRSSNPTHSQT